MFASKDIEDQRIQKSEVIRLTVKFYQSLFIDPFKLYLFFLLSVKKFSCINIKQGIVSNNENYGNLFHFHRDGSSLLCEEIVEVKFIRIFSIYKLPFPITIRLAVTSSMRSLR